MFPLRSRDQIGREIVARTRAKTRAADRRASLRLSLETGVIDNVTLRRRCKPLAAC
jgi:hypothetical protein